MSLHLLIGAPSYGGGWSCYENARSIRAKAEYLKAQGLGGVIVFEPDAAGAVL